MKNIHYPTVYTFKKVKGYPEQIPEATLNIEKGYYYDSHYTVDSFLHGRASVDDGTYCISAVILAPEKIIKIGDTVTLRTRRFFNNVTIEVVVEKFEYNLGKIVVYYKSNIGSGSQYAEFFDLKRETFPRVHVFRSNHYDLIFKVNSDGLYEEPTGVVSGVFTLDDMLYKDACVENNYYHIESVELDVSNVLKIGDNVAFDSADSHFYGKAQRIIKFKVNKEGNLVAITDLSNDNGLRVEKLRYLSEEFAKVLRICALPLVLKKPIEDEKKYTATEILNAIEASTYKGIMTDTKELKKILGL